MGMLSARRMIIADKGAIVFLNAITHGKVRGPKCSAGPGALSFHHPLQVYLPLCSLPCRGEVRKECHTVQ